MAEVTWRCSVKIGKGVSSADGSENEKNAGKFDCHAACNMQHATRGTQHTQHCTHCRMRAGPQAVHASTVCAATSSPHTTVRKILISVHDWNERAKDAKNSSVHASRVCAATFAPHSPPPARPVSTRLRTQVHDLYGVVPHVLESRNAHCTVCTYGCRDVTLSVMLYCVACCNVLYCVATCCTVAYCRVAGAFRPAAKKERRTFCQIDVRACAGEGGTRLADLAVQHFGGKVV